MADEAKKQLPLRSNKDKPVLKYSSNPAGVTTPTTTTQNNTKPPSVPLFNQSDIAMYKQQVTNNFINSSSNKGMYSSPFLGHRTHSNSPAFNNSYLFVTNPAQAGCGAITPGHLLASALPKSSRNPYARPISARDIQPDMMVKNTNLNLPRSSNSSTSLNSMSSQGSSSPPSGVIQTNSFMRPQSAMKLERKPSFSNVNTDDKITSVTDNTPVSVTNGHNVIPVHVENRPNMLDKTVSSAAPKPPTGLKPHISRPASATRPTSAKNKVYFAGKINSTETGASSNNSKPPLPTSNGVSKNVPNSSKNMSNSSGNVPNSGRNVPNSNSGSSNVASAIPSKHLSGPSIPRVLPHNDGKVTPVSVSGSGIKAPTNIRNNTTATVAAKIEGFVNHRSNSTGVTNAKINSMNSGVANGHDKPSSAPSSGRGAHLNEPKPPEVGKPTVNGYVGEPRSTTPIKPGTSAAEIAAKVRNLNYTPSKPYDQVKDPPSTPPYLSNGTPIDQTSTTPNYLNGTTSSTNKIITNIPENEMRMQQKDTRSILSRTPSTPTNHFTPKPPKNRSGSSVSFRTPHVSEEMLKDGSVKKMPVTNTLTGTIFYSKGSKEEEVIHDLNKRPKQVADGAPSNGKKEEEWEDEEEEEEQTKTVKKTKSAQSERVPGDGEASLYDDDDDDDDAFGDEDFVDDINNDFGSSDEEDNSDGYSINSGTPSRNNSATTVRLKSATKRMLNLSISETDKKSSGTPKSRPSTATRSRPASAASMVSSNTDLQPALMPSIFPNLPPTVNFVPDGEKVEQLPWEIRKLLKWKMSPITPNVVKNCIARSGFRATKKNHDWIGYFGKHMKSDGFKTIREYQKVNHFPGSFQIGRKDRLWRNLSKLQVHFGKKEFGFFPQSFILPFDMKQLKRVWEEGGSKQKWIIKPPASARGIGIKVIHKWNQIPKKRAVIVQKYLGRPYLINDSKFDIRLYVYVTSYDPLRIYLFDDGLVRFASCKYSYSTKNLNNRYMHLTNYSINKKNVDYQNNTDETVCQGHKWGLKALWGYMKKQGIATTPIWENIKDLVIKTVISSEPYVVPLMKANARRRYCCHELFGFDVMLDENYKPWIIEVNISPSLHSNSPLDIHIKGNMIKDMFNLAGFQIPDKTDVKESQPPYDASKYIPPNEIYMDKRLSPTQFSPDERAKHAYYTQRHLDEQAMSTIMDILTPDDIRNLVETIDEDTRKGDFHRIFPSSISHKYLRFFEMARYNNLLVDAWVNKYNRMEARGIAYLESLCSKGIILENPTSDPRHQWAPPNMSLISRDPRAASAPLHKQGAAVLPKLQKGKKKSATGSTSSLSTISTPLSSSRPDPPH